MALNQVRLSNLVDFPRQCAFSALQNTIQQSDELFTTINTNMTPSKRYLDARILPELEIRWGPLRDSVG